MTSRRQLLRSGGLLGASLVLPGCGRGAQDCIAGLTGHVDLAPLSAGTEAGIGLLLDAGHDEMFGVVTELLRVASPHEVFGMLLSAGARGIAPDSGDGLHATLALHAGVHLHGLLDGPMAWVPLYYGAHALDFRRSEDELGEAPTPSGRSDALDAFDQAMAAWDTEGAEQALVDAMADDDGPALVERLIRWSAREQGHIGHLMIWFGLGIQMLDALGWGHAPSVLRSIVRDATTVDQGALATSFDQRLAFLEQAGFVEGPCVADEGVTVELVQALRTDDADSQADFVTELLRDERPRQAIWDGLVLAGVEDLMGGGLGVALHRFDTINALHALYRRTQDDVTRQLLLVQTAAYMAGTASGLEADVLALEVEAVSDVDAVFDAVQDGPQAVAARVLGYLDGGGDRGALERRAAELTVCRPHPRDEHCYKFPVAVLEEAATVSEVWAPTVLAAIGGQEGRCPSTSTEPWEHLDEVLDEIASL